MTVVAVHVPGRITRAELEALLEQHAGRDHQVELHEGYLLIWAAGVADAGLSDTARDVAAGVAGQLAEVTASAFHAAFERGDAVEVRPAGAPPVPPGEQVGSAGDQAPDGNGAVLVAGLGGGGLAAPHQPTRPPRLCRGCGEEFTPPRPNQEYCTVACRQGRKDRERAQGRIQARKAARPTRPCPGCGERFSPSRKNQTYCSTRCRGLARNAQVRSQRTPPVPAKPSTAAAKSPPEAPAGKPGPPVVLCSLPPHECPDCGLLYTLSARLDHHRRVAHAPKEPAKHVVLAAGRGPG